MNLIRSALVASMLALFAGCETPQPSATASAPMQADDNDKQDKTQKGWGELVLENYYSSSVDLYVDGRYTCTAPGSGGSCTTRVRVGQHELDERAADGQSRHESIDMPPGGYTYTTTVWKG